MDWMNMVNCSLIYKLYNNIMTTVHHHCDHNDKLGIVCWNNTCMHAYIMHT